MCLCCIIFIITVLLLHVKVTDRERDFEDILTIIKQTKEFNWEIVIKETLLQTELNDGWVLLDLEKTLQRLKEHTFIPQKYFDMLYG